VKNASIALADPIKSSEANFRASKITNFHTIQVIRGLETFSLQDHSATTIKVKVELKKHKEARQKDALIRILKAVTQENIRNHQVSM
jgi:hypothetical protein